MNATVRKVAAGAAETTPIAVVTNLARTLRLLKEAGLWIVGADAEAPKLAHETDLSRADRAGHGRGRARVCGS